MYVHGDSLAAVQGLHYSHAETWISPNVLAELVCRAWLPKTVMYGQIKGRGVVGSPKTLTDVLLSGPQRLHMRPGHHGIKTRSAWKIKTVQSSYAPSLC